MGSWTTMAARIRQGEGPGDDAGVLTIRASSCVVEILCANSTPSVRKWMSAVGAVSSGPSCLAPFGGLKGENTQTWETEANAWLTLRPEDSPVCSNSILGFVCSSMLEGRGREGR